MRIIIASALVVLLALLISVNNAQFPESNQVRNALLPEGFAAWIFTQGLSRPRQITRLPNSSDLLVLEQSVGITLLFDANQNGVSEANERVTLVNGNSTNLPQTNLGLTHSILYRSGYIYSATDTTVYRWPYTVGSRAPITSAPEILITGIPAGGRHSTRTLDFDPAGRLYVQMGSQTDIDSTTTRGRTHRFAAGYFDGTLARPATPLDYFADGTVYQTGARNHVAFRFDAQGRGLGVENGIDAIGRRDILDSTEEQTANNPGEEMNLLPDINSLTSTTQTFYGYPYCWTEGFINRTASNTPHAKGTQWADQNFMNDGVHTDAWCRNSSNNIPPALVLDPHSAALDIAYYQTPSQNGTVFGASASRYQGVAFVAQHGSHAYLRYPPTGYQVIAVRYSGSTPADFTATSEPFFRAAGPGNFPNNWWRPSGVAFGNCPGSSGDCLFVTADTNGTVLAIGYYPDRYLRNTEIPFVPLENNCPVPLPCPCCPTCPTTPSTCDNNNPSGCGSCNNDDHGTNINFYFADMLRGSSN